MNPSEVIQSKWYQKLDDGRYVSRWSSNRASQLGHECMRYIYLWRTEDPAKMPMFDLRVQAIVREGFSQEPQLFNALSQMGFQVKQSQMDIRGLEKYQINGKIDGKILIDGAWLPMEIKTASQFVFDGLALTYESLKESKYPHIRKYCTQITLYLLGTNSERGVLIFKNRASQDIKVIDVPLDYELGEWAIKRAEYINKCIADGKPPDHCTNPETCWKCDINHICNPPIMSAGAGLEILNQKEVVEKIKRHYELKDKVKSDNNEIKELWAYIKQILDGKEGILIGDDVQYMIKHKELKKGTRLDITKMGE